MCNLLKHSGNVFLYFSLTSLLKIYMFNLLMIEKRALHLSFRGQKKVKVKVKIVNKSNNDLPAYSTKMSAGMDIRAYLQEPVLIKPLERKLIPTGLYIEIPKGFEAQIRPRSGLALKKGITVLNTPGTIDADYRGEIGVILVNLSQEDFIVESGERICQMIVAAHETVEWNLVETLDETERGAGGFGHTGKN